MAMARRTDERTEGQWQRLGRIRSQSGIAFFPTSHARLELEVEISESIDLT
jgi:hypothetical protein